MVLALLGSAAGAFAGKGINDMFNKAAADRSFEMNERLQENDQNFQREMRATAYQTMVEDMKKAGINPAVALASGAGQAMGGSSSASASAPSGGDADIATAAMGIKQAQAQIDNQTALTNADVELKRAQATKAMKDAGFTDKQIEYYIKHGVFPGATNTVSTSGGGLGFNYSNSITTPVGLKTPKNNSAKDLNNNELPKPPRAMSGREYRKWLKAQGYKIN